MGKSITELTDMIFAEVGDPFDSILAQVFYEIDQAAPDMQTAAEAKLDYMRRVTKAMVGSAIACSEDVFAFGGVPKMLGNIMVKGTPAVEAKGMKIMKPGLREQISEYGSKLLTGAKKHGKKAYEYVTEKGGEYGGKALRHIKANPYHYGVGGGAVIAGGGIGGGMYLNARKKRQQQQTQPQG